jgi:hypothetical protein
MSPADTSCSLSLCAKPVLLLLLLLFLQDNDRLVSSYSGGWQMRMCLGKLLLQVRAARWVIRSGLSSYNAALSF